MVSKMIDSVNSTCVTDLSYFYSTILHKDSSVSVIANAKLVCNAQIIMAAGMLIYMPYR